MEANKIKKKLVSTVLHRPFKEIESFFIHLKLKLYGPKSRGTIYIISPYKTGTTYIASLWDNSLVSHEPYHYYSLKYISKENFLFNFKRRENSLNLKAECSGFFSMHIENLPDTNQYIFILRPVVSWVQSVLNHFYSLKDLGFNYIDEYYWKKILGYSIIDVLVEKNPEKLNGLVSDLHEEYLKIIREALKKMPVSFVNMKDLDRLAEKLGDVIGVSPDFDKSWQRKSENKYDTIDIHQIITNDEFDKLVESIPLNRFYLNEV